MVWDGECSFCKKFADRFETRSKNLVELLKNEFKIKIKKKNYNLNYFNYEKNCKEVEKFYLKV